MNEQAPQDEDLRSLLRAIDPARGVPPLDPSWTTWQAARIVDTASKAPAAAPGRRGRRMAPAARWTAAMTAVAASVVVGVLALTTDAAGPMTALSLPPAGGAPAAACAPLTPQALRHHEIAFEARVRRVDGGTVILQVTRRFAGRTTDEVTVPQPGPNLPIDTAPATFRTGDRYLVAADHGLVAVCGQTGPATRELSALYEQAFGR